MKKYLFGALITFTGLFTLAAGAQAQTSDIVVHIQQDFVASGKTLPAGTYRVLQDFTGAGTGLILRGDHASTFLLPTTHEAPSSDRRAVKLTRVGDAYYLSEVATDFGVYTLPLPSLATRMAKARDLGRTSSSGSD
ncbi:MAG: hypothetical protein LAN63_07280 [Acidobacteriia bacterium]|nr:hypothetical protein [Terriglobia bacterium]